VVTSSGVRLDFAGGQYLFIAGLGSPSQLLDDIVLV
jgi:hypothetical protein